MFAECNVKGVEEDAPVLCGYAIQGGFLYGESNWDVKGATNKDGIFIIGIGMDAPENLTLKFCKPGFLFRDCKSFNYPIAQRTYQEQHIKVDDKFIHYPPEVQKRIDREREQIQKSREKSDTSFTGFLDWQYPFKQKHPTSSVYGSRRVFNGVPKFPHSGIDIAAPFKTPVRPIGEGKVVLTIDSYLAGNTVVVSHGFGMYSAYIHLDKINVEKGDIVGADSVIGMVGKTGRVSGAHLHLGLYHNQTALDPALLF